MNETVPIVKPTIMTPTVLATVLLQALYMSQAYNFGWSSNYLDMVARKSLALTFLC